MEPEQKLRAERAVVHGGGGGINVARVLGEMGRSGLAVYVAGGRTGDWLDDLLAAYGVVGRRVPTRQATRENLTVLDRSTSRQYRFVMPGPPLADRDWQEALRRTLHAARHAELVVASGSVPPGVPDRFYAMLAARLASRGKRLVLDAAGAPLRAALEQGVFVVSPNRRELDELAGVPLDDAARRRFTAGLVANGRAEIVVVKLDIDGALLTWSEGHFDVAAPDVAVRSAVGAGDSFLGAFIAALLAGWTLPDATRAAVAAGSAAVSTPGTELAPRDLTEKLWSTMTGRTLPPL